LDVVNFFIAPFFGWVILGVDDAGMLSTGEGVGQLR
jgi:hypothetical protein